LATAAGQLEVVSASAAAVDHPSDAVRAGYNLYETDPEGRIVSLEAWVVDPATLDVRRHEMPIWSVRPRGHP
jgi:hypothetical protein